MTILPVAKSAFFSKHCHFFGFFSSFFEQFYISSIFLRKWHHNDKKKINFPPNDKKMTNKIAGCKNCIFLEALSLFVFFVIFQIIFDIFQYF